MPDPIAQISATWDAYSDRVAIQDDLGTLSYGQVRTKAAALAEYFRLQGIAPTDRIAVTLPNGREFLLCYLAALLGGFTLVPINGALPKGDQDYILHAARPKLHVRDVTDLSFEDAGDERIRSTAESVLGMFFTSGTTSRPKGACHTAGGMIANVLSFNRLTGLDESTRMLHVMPMGYMAGFLNTILSPLAAGGTVVLAPQFDAGAAIQFWKPAMLHQANAVWLTPTMAALLARLNRNAEVPGWTRENLRHVFVGTAPLPETVKKAFEETFGAECLESYGMTEVLLVSANTPAFPRKSGSAGRVLDEVEMHACDEEGTMLEAGAEGELKVRSPFHLLGYLDAATGQPASALDEGWLATGDYGYVDADGDLFITARIKDLIIRGGANISPRAVEETLLKHPRVRDVAVVGKPHPFWGEEVVAFVVPEDATTLNTSELASYCKENLSPDAVPSLFRVEQSVPRSSTGKIQKHLLKERL